MKTDNRKKYMPIAASLLVILLLLNSGPAMAISSTVTTDKSSYSQGETVSLTNILNFNTYEIVPLRNVTLTIVGPSGSTIYNKDIFLSTNQDSTSSNAEYGLKFGYLATNNSGTWIYYTGNGSGWGYGYGYSTGIGEADTTIQTSYSLTNADAGTYTVYLKVYDTDGTLISQSSTTFTVVAASTTPTGSSGSVIQVTANTRAQLGAVAEAVAEVNNNILLLNQLSVGISATDQEAIDEINDLLALAEAEFAAGRMSSANELIAQANALIVALEVPDVELEDSFEQEFTLDLTQDDVNKIQQALQVGSPEIAELASAVITQSETLQSYINVDAHVESYTITDKNGAVTYKSIIKKTITNTQGDLLELNIIVDISKDVAPTVDDIIFDASANLLVIEADPIVLWRLDSLGLGETAELAYIVDGLVEEADMAADTIKFFTTAGIVPVTPVLISTDDTGEEPAAGWDLPPYVTPIIIGLVIIVVIGVISSMKGRKGGSCFKP